MVTKVKMEKLRIDVVEDLHRIRARLAGLSREEILKKAERVREEIAREKHASKKAKK